MPLFSSLGFVVAEPRFRLINEIPRSVSTSNYIQKQGKIPLSNVVQNSYQRTEDKLHLTTTSLEQGSKLENTCWSQEHGFTNHYTNSRPLIFLCLMSILPAQRREMSHASDDLPLPILDSDNTCVVYKHTTLKTLLYWMHGLNSFQWNDCKNNVKKSFGDGFCCKIE